MPAITNGATIMNTLSKAFAATTEQSVDGITTGISIKAKADRASSAAYEAFNSMQICICQMQDDFKKQSQDSGNIERFLKILSHIRGVHKTSAKMLETIGQLYQERDYEALNRYTDFMNDMSFEFLMAGIPFDDGQVEVVGLIDNKFDPADDAELSDDEFMDALILDTDLALAKNEQEAFDAFVSAEFCSQPEFEEQHAQKWIPPEPDVREFAEEHLLRK